MVRAVQRAVLAALVFAHLQAGARAQESAVANLFLHPERVELATGGYVTADRGMLLVPIVRDDPSSKTIGVEVWRFRAAEGADPDTPPIVRLYGGPGWPGLDLSDRGRYEAEILPLTRVSDLILVGQRGIGTSKPDTLCVGPPEVPRGGRTREGERAALLEACAACRAHWEAEGYDLRGLNVIEAAHDVADVARLLGYEKVTLWGGSFGSHWGMAVMRYHPEVVARAVLTGLEGPDHTYDMPSGVLEALEQIASAAESSRELAMLVPDGGLIEAFKTVIARVDEDPVEVELPDPRSGRRETVRFDAERVRELALGYTSRVSSRRGVPTWPADILALFAGDFSRAARVSLDQRNEGLPTASFFMLDCGSGISQGRLAELSADPAAAVVGDLGRWYQSACSVWDSDLGDEFRAGAPTGIPTVIVHGTWDVNTPFRNALELLDYFLDHRFVIVDGGSHGALDEAMDHSPAFRAALMRFVVSGDMEGIPDVVEMPPIAWASPHSAR